MIAGAMYNNTDSWGHADTGTPETQKNRRYRRFFKDMVRVTGFEPAASCSQTYREYFFRSFIAVFGAF